MNISTLLPELLPRACAWATSESARILASGEKLSPQEFILARQMGVERPEQIRILMVKTLPIPADPLLAEVGRLTGLFAPGIVGLTLGHGIFLCMGYRSNQLVSHECRHVYQYEQAGSMESFLGTYLRQIAEFGYAKAPLEVDAYSMQVSA